MRVVCLMLLGVLGSSGVAAAHPVATLIGTVEKNEMVYSLVSDCKQGQRRVYLHTGSGNELAAVVGKTVQVTGDMLMPRDPLNGNKMQVVLFAPVDLKGKKIVTLRGKVDRPLVSGKRTWVLDKEKGDRVTLLASAGGVGDFSWWVDDSWTVRVTGYQTDKGFVVLEVVALQLFGGKDVTGPIEQRPDPEAKACHVGAIGALKKNTSKP